MRRMTRRVQFCLYYLPKAAPVGGVAIPALLKDMTGGFNRQRGGFING